jgi:excinuclease ABC subunit A
MRAADPEAIVIRGAREHNLQGVDVSIPKRQFVVITGVSGSGKSSLAFDTLFAEGQRRYVESLSVYARQFLGQMEKPKFDSIRGLSPTIAIEQKTASSNPRSTVGTVTEIHDHLRVLFARVGVQHCHQCGRAVGRQSAQQIVKALRALPDGTRLTLLAPVVRQRKGEHKDVMESLVAQGFVRARVDGKTLDLSEAMPALEKKTKHSVEAVIDRVALKGDVTERLTDSVESALRVGGGALIAQHGEHEEMYSEHNACTRCNLSFDELSPQHFSFNSPLGFCPTCNGLGTRPEMDPALIVPRGDLSIREGAVLPWAGAMQRAEGWTADQAEWVIKTFRIDAESPWEKLPKAQRDVVLWGAKSSRGKDWEGLAHQLLRRFQATTSEDMRQYYLRFLSDKPCPDCKGTRLRPERRAVKVHGTSLDALAAMPLSGAHAWLSGLELHGAEAEIASELRKETLARMGFLLDVGLGYLSLDRAAATLSGGEGQRIRLASQIGSELTGVVYILDEPSIGLHPRDNGRLLRTLERLRDLGNTVVVVEHDEETLRRADWLIDIGPGAGDQGGRVVAEGPPAGIIDAPESVTAAFLSGRRSIATPTSRRPGDGRFVEVLGARAHNLKDIDVRIPLGTFTAVTGVSGAGKSTLVNRILLPALGRALHDAREPVGAHRALKGLEHLDKVIAIDQRPIGRTPRSNPATYTKLFDPIREVFASVPEARAWGYDRGRFSFNVKGGRCEACGGDGLRTVEMHFLADVYVTCEECKGRRFNDATLRVKYKGLSIADVLDLRVSEAVEVFSVHKEIRRTLGTLMDVGVGYLQLGQPSPTLSGGEAQRIKLSRELAKVATGRTLYVLDEPTTGLHFADVERLLAVLQRLVDAGNTVLVIEHDLDVIRCADHVIDLGPEGGAAGGSLLAAGTPEEVARHPDSYTGRFLRDALAR